MKNLLLLFFLLPAFLIGQTFAPPVTVFVDPDVNIFTGIRAADIDNDDILDLVMSTADINSFWVKGSGDSNFGAPNVIFNDEIFGEAAAALDADNDGDMDVVTAASFSNDILYSENLGEGEFATAVILVEDQYPIETMTLFDVDNDENDDVIVSARSASNQIGELFLLRNLGDGTFGSKEVLLSDIQDVRTISHGDFDGDGDEDLLIGTYWDSKFFWAENNGDGVFTILHEINPPDQDRTYSTATNDFDNDGDIDILQSISAMTLIYYNDGDGNFGEGQEIINKTAWYLTSADIDSDGDKDIIQGFVVDDQLAIFLNDGTGQFDNGNIIASEVGAINFIEIVDWDGDGDLDMFTSSSLFDEFLYFENLVDIPVNSIDNEAFSVSIYPNPASEYINIKVDETVNYTVVVYDMKGETLLRIKNAKSIPLSDLSSGSYIIKIEDMDSKSSVVESIVVLK